MADLKFLVDDWPVISRRLDEVLSLPAADRDTWLDALHEPDALKSALRRLLADAVGMETGDFLESLPRLTLDPDAGSSAVGDDDAASAGLIVGAYRLIRQLGVGGMGTVWLGERIDGALKRQVAVKLPRASWASGLGERMARERDILASLDHPNIARIHDAGLDGQGRPYLALEYVAGEPIDAYCKRLALPTRERLALILQVARAVAHAHARLVVHRDLKPANILVTAEGQVRLLDFGIAKLMEGELTQETALTMQAGRALTLDYASPEQIRGEPIGTASDVYSLGVVAYELLAEARPYQLRRQSAAALEEAIASVDVRPASAAATSEAAKRALKGDLDAILNKAMKKAVADRYPTVEAFAQDVERHLARVPVLARPDTVAYRTRRFLSRNTLAVAAAAAVSVSLLAGLSAALWQARAAMAQAERAEQVKSFALSIFESADTDSGAGAATTAADLLLAAQARVDKELAGRPEMAVELMTAIGYSLLGQSRPKEAEAILAKAVAMASRELDAHSRTKLTATVVHGEALVGIGQAQRAIELLKPAAEEARRQGAMHEWVNALRWRASAEIDVDATGAALDTMRAAMAVLDMPAARDLRKLDVYETTASYATTLQLAKQPGQAEVGRRALVLAKEIYGDQVSAPVLMARKQLGAALAEEGRLKEAMNELSILRDDTIRFLGANHLQSEHAIYSLGAVQLTAGDFAGAAASFETTLVIQKASPQGGPRTLGIEHQNLASALNGLRRRDEALAHLDTAIALFAKAGSASAGQAQTARSTRALTLTALGRLDEADLEFASLAEAPFKGAVNAVHASRLSTLRSLQGRHDEAIALAQSAQAAVAVDPSKAARALVSHALGDDLLRADRAADAAAPLAEAVRLYGEQRVMMTPDQADATALHERARALAAASVAPPTAR